MNQVVAQKINNNVNNNSLDSQKHGNKSTIFLMNQIKQIRLKFMVRRFANRTTARIYKQLKPEHFKLIADNSQDILNSQKEYHNIEKALHLNINKLFNLIMFIKSLVFYVFKFIPIFSPSSRLRMIWDLMQIFAIIFFIIIIPIHIAFQISFSNLIGQEMLLILTILIQADTLILLNTGYYEKGQFINNDRRKIIKNFIKHDLVYELLGSVSVIFNYFHFHQVESLNVQILLHGLFIFKLRNLTNLAIKFQEQFLITPKIQNILKLLKLLTIVIIISHIYACVWIFVGEQEHIHGHSNWLYSKISDDSTMYSKYCYSYYYITVTMATIGYGDITPVNPIEQIICIVTMLTTSGLFGYSINTIGQILLELQKQEEEKKKSIYIIKNYMNLKQINKDLQFEVRQYLEYYFQEFQSRNPEEENYLIGLLPETMKQNLMIEANKMILKDFPLFSQNFSENTIQQTIPIINQYRATPEQIIISEGTADDDSIYFIDKGKIEIFSCLDSGEKNQKIQYKSFKILTKGNSFGKYSFFTGLPQQYSARSIGFSTLLKIRRNDFIKILKRFPEDYEMFCQIKDDVIQNNNLQIIGSLCYSCKSKHHFINQCPYIHFIANKQKVINKSNLSENQKREILNRYQRPKFRSLINIQQVVNMVDKYFEFNEQNIINYERDNKLGKDFCENGQDCDDDLNINMYDNTPTIDKHNLTDYQLTNKSQTNEFPDNENLSNIQDKQIQNDQIKFETEIENELNYQHSIKKNSQEEINNDSFQNIQSTHQQFQSQKSFNMQSPLQTKKASKNTTRRMSKIVYQQQSNVNNHQAQDIKIEIATNHAQNLQNQNFQSIFQKMDKLMNQFEKFKNYNNYFIWNNLNYVLDMSLLKKNEFKMYLQQLKNYQYNCQDRHITFNYKQVKKPSIYQLNLQNNVNQIQRNIKKLTINTTQNHQFNFKLNNNKRQTLTNYSPQIQKNEQPSIQRDVSEDYINKEESIVQKLPQTITGKFPYQLDNRKMDTIYQDADVSFNNNDIPLYQKEIQSSYPSNLFILKSENLNNNNNNI